MASKPPVAPKSDRVKQVVSTRSGGGGGGGREGKQPPPPQPIPYSRHKENKASEITTFKPSQPLLPPSASPRPKPRQRMSQLNQNSSAASSASQEQQQRQRRSQTPDKQLSDHARGVGGGEEESTPSPVSSPVPGPMILSRCRSPHSPKPFAVPDIPMIKQQRRHNQHDQRHHLLGDRPRLDTPSPSPSPRCLTPEQLLGPLPPIPVTAGGGEHVHAAAAVSSSAGVGPTKPLMDGNDEGSGDPNNAAVVTMEYVGMEEADSHYSIPLEPTGPAAPLLNQRHTTSSAVEEEASAATAGLMRSSDVEYMEDGMYAVVRDEQTLPSLPLPSRVPHTMKDTPPPPPPFPSSSSPSTNTASTASPSHGTHSLAEQVSEDAHYSAPDYWPEDNNNNNKPTTAPIAPTTMPTAVHTTDRYEEVACTGDSFKVVDTGSSSSSPPRGMLASATQERSRSSSLDAHGASESMSRVGDKDALQQQQQHQQELEEEQLQGELITEHEYAVPADIYPMRSSAGAGTGRQGQSSAGEGVHVHCVSREGEGGHDGGEAQMQAQEVVEGPTQVVSPKFELNIDQLVQSCPITRRPVNHLYDSVNDSLMDTPSQPHPLLPTGDAETAGTQHQEDASDGSTHGKGLHRDDTLFRLQNPIYSSIDDEGGGGGGGEKVEGGTTSDSGRDVFGRHDDSGHRGDDGFYEGGGSHDDMGKQLLEQEPWPSPHGSVVEQQKSSSAQQRRPRRPPPPPPASPRTAKKFPPGPLGSPKLYRATPATANKPPPPPSSSSFSFPPSSSPSSSPNPTRKKAPPPPLSTKPRAFSSPTSPILTKKKLPPAAPSSPKPRGLLSLTSSKRPSSPDPKRKAPVQHLPPTPPSPKATSVPSKVLASSVAAQPQQPPAKEDRFSKLRRSLRRKGRPRAASHEKGNVAGGTTADDFSADDSKQESSKPIIDRESPLIQPTSSFRNKLLGIFSSKASAGSSGGVGPLSHERSGSVESGLDKIMKSKSLPSSGRTAAGRRKPPLPAQPPASVRPLVSPPIVAAAASAHAYAFPDDDDEYDPMYAAVSDVVVNKPAKVCVCVCVCFFW